MGGTLFAIRAGQLARSFAELPDQAELGSEERDVVPAQNLIQLVESW